MRACMWMCILLSCMNSQLYQLQVSDEHRMAIARGVANGVQYMHTRDPIIIHQDLKPLNIIVSN